MKQLLHFLFRIAIGISLCSICLLIFEPAPAQEKLPVTATRVTSAPKIDGKLDDECWKEGKLYNNFFEGAPQAGIPSKNTEAMIVYDNDAIYASAKCLMNRDSIWMELTARDNLQGYTDALYVGFDTYSDGQNGFGFGVSPQNVQSDFKLFQNSNTDDTWDAVWESAVTINDDGWYVEIKIPYSALRFPKVNEQHWTMDIFRIIRSNRTEYHSDNYDPKVSGIVSQWQPLEGLLDIVPPLRLSLSPYGTLYYNLYRDKSLDVHQEDLQFKGGVDLKWGISQSFTLDATLIPDFGQVQSDNIVYNLTAFEVQYDEKRPFFTEGTELFNKATLFYSRRVGFVSDYYSTHSKPGAILINSPGNTKLLNATKFSGRTKHGLGIGVFNAVTGNTYGEAVTAEGDTEKVLIDPLSNFNVLVLDQSLKNNSFITFTNTNVIRDAKGRDANVANVLTFLANKKYTYGAYGYLAVSTLRNEFPDDSTHFMNGTLSKIGIQKLSGNFTFEVSHRSISPGFNENDLGFLEISNQNTAEATLHYDIYEPFGKFNEFHGVSTLDYDYRNSNGDFIAASVDGSAYFLTRNYLGIYNYYFLRPFGFHNYYEPRVEGRYYSEPAVYEFGFGLSTDYRKNFALDFEGGPAIWNEPGRIKYRWFIAPRIRIGDHLFIVPSNQTHLYMNDVGFVDIDSASNIIFGRRNVTEVDNIINGNYYFNANISLGLQLRYYTNKGVYDQYYFLNNDGTLTATAYNSSADYNFNAWNIDMTFTWWFLPGSEMNVVWKNAITGFDDITNLNFVDNLNHTFDSPANNNISIRIRYYLDYQMVKKLVKP